ncbi:Pro-resilin [Portunus trituberculatus]|uniref:Pro-resilin n=1 Tax=Portunus trituberculatus TaxID=210409 RepID=A0A5B7HA78_PORTR|nr:Pro-resilin [Portunus trituberculatus]
MVVVLAAADKRPPPVYSYQAPERHPRQQNSTQKTPPIPSILAYTRILNPSSSPHQEFSEESYESYESTEAKYDFNYAVRDEYSGNNFGHQESRDGDHTQGSYYVQLPDGRLQKVTYYVDGDSGYVAEVSYEGEAHYPESEESRESYSPPRPSYSPPKPRPTYAPPQPTYAPPKPQPSYAPPKPQPTYAPPKPQPTYAPPQQAYAPPQPTYAPPRRTYGFPQ